MADKGGISGTAVFVAVIGAVLVWSGVKDKKLSAIAQDLIAGNDPTTSGTGVNLQDQQYLQDLLVPPGTPGAPSGPGPLPVPQSNTARKNQAIAKPLAAAMGWTGDQWGFLVKLWNQESGWSNTAVNPKSGATGIPQALPASKLPLAGQAPSFDAYSQILWGLSYIKAVYKTPERAWAHELQHNWY